MICRRSILPEPYTFYLLLFECTIIEISYGMMPNKWRLSPGIWCLPCICGRLTSRTGRAFSSFVYTRLHTYFLVVPGNKNLVAERDRALDDVDWVGSAGWSSYIYIYIMIDIVVVFSWTSLWTQASSRWIFLNQLVFWLSVTLNWPSSGLPRQRTSMFSSFYSPWVFCQIGQPLVASMWGARGPGVNTQFQPKGVSLYLIISIDKRLCCSHDLQGRSCTQFVESHLHSEIRCLTQAAFQNLEQAAQLL